MKTHDNQKPFQCTVCNRGYNTAAALTSHMQSHKKQSTLPRTNALNYRYVQVHQFFAQNSILNAFFLEKTVHDRRARHQVAVVYINESILHILSNETHLVLMQNALHTSTILLLHYIAYIVRKMTSKVWINSTPTFNKCMQSYYKR